MSAHLALGTIVTVLKTSVVAQRSRDEYARYDLLAKKPRRFSVVLELPRSAGTRNNRGGE